MSQAKEILQEVFGFTSFRNYQEEIINKILQKKEHVLAIMPTGSGKSLCFQIPGLLQKSTTIVISPLIALMKDQVDNLHKKGITNVYFYNSTLEDREKEIILDKLKTGSVKMLYCAPETLKQRELQNASSQISVDLLVIDEAHCISLWGHNFRPDYLRIKYFHKRIHSPQILALTATATKNIEKDILNQLGINARVFRTSFDRPNLTLNSLYLPPNIIKEYALSNLLKKIKQPAVIFVTTQKAAENLSRFLQNNNFDSKHYHAGMTKEDRNIIQELFMKNGIKILVATIAFGMGIDKKDIRTIIHFNIPQSTENYYQEIGRGGRDGESAECITMISDDDIEAMKKLIKRTWPKREKIEGVINYLNKQEIFFTTIKKLAGNLEIDEIAIDMILQQLEHENQISTQSNIIYEVKIELLKDLDLNDLKDLSLNERKLLIDGFFKNKRKKWFNSYHASLKYGIPYFEVYNTLQELHKKEIINIVGGTNKTRIVRNEELKRDVIEKISNTFETKKRIDLEKVDQLIQCLSNDRCIRNKILAYFGENRPKKRCNNCSACKKQKDNLEHVINNNYIPREAINEFLNKIKIKNNKGISNIILHSILKFDISNKDLIAVLTGTLSKSHASWKKDQEIYGVLSNFSEKKEILEKVVEDLIKNNMMIGDIKDDLKITRKGFEWLKSTF